MAQQIESKDIKLYASEKLSDADDAGGRVTANEIKSGQVNNVFQDISRVDHANGSVELRKMFMGIRTQNSAPLLGAHMLVVEPPKDPNVSVLIFQTPKESREIDVRTEARDYLENYYIKAAREFVQPLGLNVEMSNTLTLFAAATVPVNIAAGDTVVLYDSAKDVEEYVKVQSISVAMQQFVYQVPSENARYETFRAQIVRCRLVSPLMRTWDGGEARPSGVENSKLTVFSTIITDAARYRGATKLIAPLDAGETVANVENVLQPLVPVARQEQALVGRSPYTDIAPVIRGTDADETPLQVKATPSESSGVLYMPTAVARGSMTIEAGSASWVENGGGELVQSSGALSAVLRIDYASGILNYDGVKGVALTIRYLPAASADIPAVTTGVEITQANLGLVYTFDLSDLPPEPGTLHIEYMAAGDWLVMTDNTQGAVVGQGIGTVDYATGQIQVTLEREPEVGSYILVSYLPGSGALFGRPSGVQQLEDIQYNREVAFSGLIKPGSLVIKDVAGVKESTDDSAGAFSGTAGSGSVNYATGRISFAPTAAAQESTYEITVETSDTGKIDAMYATSIAANTNVSLSVGRALMPGTLRMTIPVRSHVKRKSYELFARATERITKGREVKLTDDGAGNVRGYSQSMGSYTGGTIDYVTGAISLPGFLKADTYIDIEAGANNGAPTKVQYSEFQTVENEKAHVQCVYDTANYTSQTKTLTVEAVEIRVIGVAEYEPIIPRSLWFRIEGVDYFDNGDGKIITSYSPLTGAGTQVGNIDYANGLLSLSSVSVTAKDVDVKSLVTLQQGMTSAELLFAIKDRPLRHSSFQMNVTAVDGTVRRYAADANGVISVVGAINANVGTINVQTGVVSINASALAGGVKSRSSVLGSLRYNAVKSESLPVDPDIVGLNVQRLPIDGRVPIFKLGDTVVLNHALEQSITTPMPGMTHTIERNHLAEVSVLCGGIELDPNQYESDLEAGTLTFADPLVLQDVDAAPLTGDWVIKHRIEHMSIATRVQQSGRITLQVSSAHDFPADTIVSSALLFGDLQADVLNIYTQKTWQQSSPNWTNKADASGETTARYDTINYPVQVSNESAVTDRWALVFKSSSTVDVVSENLGVIATGLPTGGDIAPINPVTGTPYFVLSNLGWGGGWSTGNALRFNTNSALAPFWCARTKTPAQGVTESDGFMLSPRGDSQ